MKIELKQPPRKYRCGLNQQIEISDCGCVYLADNEQLTFVTYDGREHDFAAKSWGFYATPSVNSRLVAQGFKTALVKNSKGQYFIMVVNTSKLKEFHDYLLEENQEITEWIDERT